MYFIIQSCGVALLSAFAKHLNKVSLCLSFRHLYRMKQRAFHGMIFMKFSILDFFFLKFVCSF